jgi:hypothetical protein
MENSQLAIETDLLRQRLDRLRLAFVQTGWIGVIIGYTLMTLFLPGGHDGHLFYLRPSWSGATAPPWIFAITSPANGLDGPLRWTYLVVVSLAATIFAQRAIKNDKWWIVLLNHAFFVNIWLGQIEFATLLGLALAWLVVGKRAHPFMFGIGGALLLTKVQVGGGLALLFAFWIWREQGFKSIAWTAFTGLAIFALTLIANPNWPIDYLHALQTLDPKNQWWSSAIFPFGLVFLPLAFYPGDVGKLRRARMIGAATLLASPYFTWYHATTVMVLETRTPVMWISWLDVLRRAVFGPTLFGWFLPAVMLCWDVWQIWHERRKRVLTAKP